MEQIERWLVNMQGKGNYYDIEYNNNNYVYVYNMKMFRQPDKDWKGYLGDNNIVLGNSDYGLGTFSLLAFEKDTGRIQKYICDTGGSKYVAMDFDTLQDLLEYEKTSIYPDAEACLTQPSCTFDMRLKNVYM